LAEKELVFGDVEREMGVTRQVLGALPEEKFGWKPHAKSMSLMQLGLHVATLPGWLESALAGDELDFAHAPRPPAKVDTTAELVGIFDKHVAGAREAMAKFDMGNWNKMWTMRNGEQVFTAQRRPKVARVWCLNHLVHHRGQLCLYLRLLDVKVPTVYFNTADDPSWVFD
jgi:uncharacterized damage-inducible protein DinB